MPSDNQAAIGVALPRGAKGFEKGTVLQGEVRHHVRQHVLPAQRVLRKARCCKGPVRVYWRLEDDGAKGFEKGTVLQAAVRARWGEGAKGFEKGTVLQGFSSCCPISAPAGAKGFEKGTVLQEEVQGGEPRQIPRRKGF